MSGEYKISWLCEALLVSRSGYYDWRQRREQPGPRARTNVALRVRIRQEFESSRQTYGSPRITRALDGLARRKRVARLMRQERLWARQRSKFRVATTDSRHDGPIAPNLLKDVAPTGPNQVWVTDATCVLTGQGWLYVVAFLDLYSRRIVGWAMQDSLDAKMVIDALQMAIGQRRPKPGLIVHSDWGTQYASGTYRAVLRSIGWSPR